MPRKRQPKSKRPKGKAAVKNPCNRLCVDTKYPPAHNFPDPYKMSDQDKVKLCQLFEYIAINQSDYMTDKEMEDAWNLLLSEIWIYTDYAEFFLSFTEIVEMSYLYGVDIAMDIIDLEQFYLDD